MNGGRPPELLRLSLKQPAPPPAVPREAMKHRAPAPPRSVGAGRGTPPIPRPRAVLPPPPAVQTETDIEEQRTPREHQHRLSPLLRWRPWITAGTIVFLTVVVLVHIWTSTQGAVVVASVRTVGPRRGHAINFTFTGAPPSRFDVCCTRHHNHMRCGVSCDMDVGKRMVCCTQLDANDQCTLYLID